MKNYTYTGTSNLTFTHDGKDYLAHGAGPHELPEEAEPVKVNVAHGKLTEVKAKVEAEAKKKDQ